MVYAPEDVLKSRLGAKRSEPGSPFVKIPDYLPATIEGTGCRLKAGIYLAVGQATTVDLMLRVAELKQNITAEEAPSPVRLSTQPMSGLVSEGKVKGEHRDGVGSQRRACCGGQSGGGPPLTAAFFRRLTHGPTALERGLE